MDIDKIGRQSGLVEVCKRVRSAEGCWRGKYVGQSGRWEVGEP